MKVFKTLVKTEFYTYLAYRLNFVLWRLRNFLWLVFLYFFWKAVFQGEITLFGYTKNEIFLYILFAQVVSSFVLSTATGGIGGMINDGTLTDILLLPYSFFKIMAAKEVIDKLVNFAFSIFEIFLFILLFNPEIVGVQLTWQSVLMFIISLLLATTLYFFIALNLGFIGFWSTEVWAPRFLFMVVVWLLAGNYFPLDVLPTGLYKALNLLPFPYLVYFPVKVLLGKAEVAEVAGGVFVLFVWTLIFYGFTKFLWIKGLKVYTAQGA